MKQGTVAMLLLASLAWGCRAPERPHDPPGQEAERGPVPTEADERAAGTVADPSGAGDARVPDAGASRKRDAGGRGGPAGGSRLAPAPAPAPAPPPPAPALREVTLPAGTALRLALATAVSSDKSDVEDTVRATTSRAVVVDGTRVLPEGTEIVGVVTDVQRSGRVKGRAHVAFRFTSLHHDGERYDIRTRAVSRTAEATKGEDATKIAAGAGAGAIVGAVIGGGSGAAKGAAIGGAGGTGVVLATRGKEVRLGPGAAVTATLAEPLTMVIRED